MSYVTKFSSFNEKSAFPSCDITELKVDPFVEFLARLRCSCVAMACSINGNTGIDINGDGAGLDVVCWGDNDRVGVA